MATMRKESRGEPERQKLVMERQLLGLSSVNNARQLGGYRIGGKRVRPDVLLRSGALARLSAEDAALLRDRYRVCCVYDLRSEEERHPAPDVPVEGAEQMTLSASLSSSQLPEGVDMNDMRSILRFLLANAGTPLVQTACQQLYVRILFEEENQRVLRRFLADVARREGAVLWHCTQGKDRAGCASAVLLAVLGAGRDLLVQDFALSAAFYDSLAAQVPTQTEEQRTVIQTLITANVPLFEAALDEVDRRYGSMEAYLAECLGVTETLRRTLRDRFLE